MDPVYGGFCPPDALLFWEGKYHNERRKAMISVRMSILRRTKKFSNMDSLGEYSLPLPTFNMGDTEKM